MLARRLHRVVKSSLAPRRWGSADGWTTCAVNSPISRLQTLPTQPASQNSRNPVYLALRFLGAYRWLSLASTTWFIPSSGLQLNSACQQAPTQCDNSFLSLPATPAYDPSIPVSLEEVARSNVG